MTVEAKAGAAPRVGIERAEARRELVGMADGRVGAIPAGLLADHVLGLDRNADWPVLRAAMEALQRRYSFARRDELTVDARPPAGQVLGEYSTRVRGRRGAQRPYRTRLEALRPVRASCDCPDFRRSSLGLCKHALVVLDELAGKPRRWKAAFERPAAEASGPVLEWDSKRPLVGDVDWLERIRLRPGDDVRSLRSVAYQRIARRFAKGAAGAGVLKAVNAGDPRRRLELVIELREFARFRERSKAPVGPALIARLDEERAELERCLELRSKRSVLRRALRGLRRPLYSYQREGVERFFERGRLLLADDMGLGKTAQAIACAHALSGAGLVKRGLFVVPASLKAQWEREWKSFSALGIELVEGPAAARAEQYRRTRRGFLVANYEQLLRDGEAIAGFDPQLVVLDEAQRIKNWAAKTSHAVKALRPRYRLVLTGTPMENRLDELASIMDWVDDHALEPKWRLVPWHTIPVDGEKGIAGARHLDELRARLAPCMLRRVRKEILTQLPPRTDTHVPVELTPEQREAHDELSQPIANLARVSERRPLTQAEFLRLMSLLTTQRIICNGLAQLQFQDVWPGIRGVTNPDARLLRGLSAPKLAELREILEQLVVDQGRKVVVFSQWRRMLQLAGWAVSGLLAEHGLRTLFFTGAEGSRRRIQNLVDFHDDPNARVLFATDAGGVGLNLQHAATACLNLELPWNPAVLEQRVARIHRLGQTEPVDVYHLVSRNSIEERIAGLVADKRQLFVNLFDGDSDEVRFERSGRFLEGVRRVASDESAPTRRASGLRDELEEDVDQTQLPEVEYEDQLPEPAPQADSPAEPGDGFTDAAEVESLFSRLSVQRTDEGGLRIEAPPEAAATLAALFEGFARALRSN